MLVGEDSDVYVLSRPYVRWQVPERGFNGKFPQAVTIGLDGRIVLVPETGYLNVLIPPYDETNELLIPLPNGLRIDVVPVGGERVLMRDPEGTYYLFNFFDQELKELPPFESPSLFGLPSVAAIVDENIVIVDGLGAVAELPLVEEEWTVTIPRESRILPADAVTITPNGTIVRATREGRIFTARRPYSEWNSIVQGPTQYPRLVAVGPTESIVVVDREGNMYQSETHSGEWNGPFALPNSPLEAVAVGTDDVVVIVDRDGNVFESPSPYNEWNLLLGPVTPSILSWMALGTVIVVAVFAVPAVRRSFRRAKAVSDQDLIRIESDRATESLDSVTPSMKSVAKRIFRTIRHRDASAPFVFAITGSWGSGKSSLMNVVRIQLEDDGCPCISFNAWHHQNETHLFASLMESIRRDAVPNRSFGGLFGFYGSLLLQRFFDNRLRIAFWGIFAFTIVVLLVLMLVEFDMKSVVDYIKLAALLVVQSWTWITRWNPLKAFGVSPASLVRASGAWIQFPRFADRLSFRHKFGRSFMQVCRAFGNRHLVIIIDDLDRCRSEQVLEILEAVNFLTSNGECFVLLGVDEVRVKHAVGLHLQRIAEEMAMTDHEYPSKDKHCQDTDEMSDLMRYRIRQAYAEHYLDKLINMRVPVPRPEWKELSDVL